MTSSIAVPPLLPGSLLLSTLEVDKAKIKTLLGDSLSTLNTWKSSVRVASTANIASLVGETTVDGVVLVAGNTILLKNQSTASQNGLYVVKTLAWQRKSDMPVGISAAGVAVFINEGTTNADKVFVCTNNPGSDIVGTSALTFTALVADALAQGTIDQIQVSDGAGTMVASAATATVAGLLTGATGVVATTGGVTATAGNVTATAGSVVVTTSTQGLTLNSTKAAATAATWAAGATINARQGLITVTNANVAADTVTSFVVTNSTVAANSLIFLNAVTNANTGPFAMEVSAISAGVSFTVRLVAPVALVGGNAAVIAFAIM
jgi:hypothetical protein